MTDRTKTDPLDLPLAELDRLLARMGEHMVSRIALAEATSEVRPAPAEQERLAAILSADIVGYSTLSLGDERAAVGAARDFQEAVSEIAPKHDGRIFKVIGDGILCEFGSLSSALEAALELQEVLRRAEYSVRAAIHFGEVVPSPDGDLLGESVNRTTRLDSFASPGGIVVSGPAHDALRKLSWAVFAGARQVTLKGYPEPVAVFDVDVERSQAPLGATDAGRGGAVVLGAAGGAVALAAGLALAGWSRLGAESYMALWATVTGGTWFLFDKAERSLSPAVRARTARWLRGLSPGELVGGIPDAFRLMFDKLFGERHLTWKCFYRSCFASLVAVGTGLALWLLGRPEAAFLASDPAFVRAALWLVFFTGLLNFVPDYISLLETRFLLGSMAGRRRLATILLADLVFTATISFVLIRLSMGLVYGSGVVLFDLGSPEAATMRVENEDISFGNLRDQLVDMITMDESWGDVSLSLAVSGEDTSGEIPVPVGIFFYSAFVTSAWLWLFTLATLLVRFVSGLGRAFRPLLRLLDYERAPFRALGYVSAVMISGIFALGLLFVIL